MFLTAEEIRELTGYTRPRKQAEWLRVRGYPFELGGDGTPKVLRDFVLSRLGGTIKGHNSEPKLCLP